MIKFDYTIQNKAMFYLERTLISLLKFKPELTIRPFHLNNIWFADTIETIDTIFHERPFQHKNKT